MGFLIRRANGDFVDLPVGEGSLVFDPEAFETSLVDGYRVCAVRLGEALATFSYEMPGIQITVEEGELAEEFIEAIRARFEAETAQALVVYRIT